METQTTNKLAVREDVAIILINLSTAIIIALTLYYHLFHPLVALYGTVLGVTLLAISVYNKSKRCIISSVIHILAPYLLLAPFFIGFSIFGFAP